MKERPALTDDSRFPFGTHKGKRMKEVPAAYLDWLEGQDWSKKWPDILAYIEENRSAINQELQESEDKGESSRTFAQTKLPTHKPDPNIRKRMQGVNQATRDMRDFFQKTGRVGTRLDCPVCNGKKTLACIIAPNNLHVGGRCDTEGCLCWMQ